MRPTTDRDHWSVDDHLDWLFASLSTDAENSGLMPANQSGGTDTVTAGISLRVGDWAGALTGTIQSTQVQGIDGAGTSVPLNGELLRAQFALARWLPRIDVAIGAALDVGQFSLNEGSGFGGQQLFAISAIGGEVGATWIPTGRSLRLGANAQTGLRGGGIVGAACDPLNCNGYILPGQIVAPWQLAVGAAYRFGPTPWNILYPAVFRDEAALTVVADLVVIGSIADSDGLEAMGVARAAARAASTPRCRRAPVPST